MVEITKTVSFVAKEGLRMFTKSAVSKFGKTATNLRNLAFN